MTSVLERLVSCESPSADERATGASAKLFGDLAAETLGARPELLAAGGRTQVRMAWGTPLGMAPLRGVPVGGGSDGNLTAGAGVPTPALIEQLR